ncbi:MAG: type II toxin-antitoxin system Phd/YefM family antitoxin [Thermoanaerobaculia bacterium]
MSTVSTRVLKDQLSSYLQRAERGERIVVLRDGRPVAALIPLSQLPRRNRAAAPGRARVPRSGDLAPADGRRVQGPCLSKPGQAGL